MKAYDLVLGLKWFKVRNTEIDWTNGRLTSLWTPNGPQLATIPEPHHQANCQNAVRKPQSLSLVRINNHLGLLHSVTALLVRTWLGIRHMTWRMSRVAGRFSRRRQPRWQKPHDVECATTSSGSNWGRRVRLWRCLNHGYPFAMTRREKFYNGGDPLWWTVLSSYPRLPTNLPSYKERYKANKAIENRNSHT